MWLQKQFNLLKDGKWICYGRSPYRGRRTLAWRESGYFEDQIKLTGWRTTHLYTTQFDNWHKSRKNSRELHEKLQWFYMNCGNYNLVNIQFSGALIWHLYGFAEPRGSLRRPHVVSLFCWKCVAWGFLSCCRCIACPECQSLLVAWPRFWCPDIVWRFWACFLLWDLNDKQCLNELT